MNSKHLVPALLCLSVSAPALAGSMALRPGLWHFSTTSEYPGTPYSAPPLDFKRCLTKKQAERPWAHLGKPGKQACTYTHAKISGNKATWTMECHESGSRMTGTGSAVASDSKHFSSVAHFLMHSGGYTMKLVATTTGQWLGASCGH